MCKYYKWTDSTGTPLMIYTRTLPFSLLTELEIQFKQPLEDQTAMATTQAVFTALINKPNQKIEWWINGKPIKLPSDKYEVENVDCAYTLKIKDLAQNDAGKVMAKFKNTDSTATLTVTGKAFVMHIWNFDTMHCWMY